MLDFQAVYYAKSQGLNLTNSASPLALEQCSVDGSIDRPDFPLLSSEEQSVCEEQLRVCSLLLYTNIEVALDIFLS